MTNKYIKLTDGDRANIAYDVACRLTDSGIVINDNTSTIIANILSKIDLHKLNPAYKEDKQVKEDNKSCDNCGGTPNEKCSTCEDLSNWTPITPDPITDIDDTLKDVVDQMDINEPESITDIEYNDDELKMAVSNVEGLIATMKEDFDALQIYAKKLTETLKQ